MVTGGRLIVVLASPERIAASPVFTSANASLTCEWRCVVSRHSVDYSCFIRYAPKATRSQTEH
jgi:hypothetical protein